jgi:hypothetical protein
MELYFHLSSARLKVDIPLNNKFWASDSLGALVTLKAFNIIAQGKRT